MDKLHETPIFNKPVQLHPEKYLHSAARRRAGLPAYLTPESKRTRQRNKRWRPIFPDR